MRRLISQIKITVIFLSVLLAACSPSSEPQLRVGTNIWPGYEPLYLAEHLGNYDNTSIKIVEMASSSQVMQALRNNTLEAAALTLDETLTLVETGFKLKVILVLDHSNGSDVLLAKPEIHSINDLKGKQIAVETTAVGAIMLDGALTEAGMSFSDVTIMECPYSQHSDCFQTADAVITFEPMKTKLIKMGAVQLFDSSQIPNRIIDVLVVREDVIENDQKALKRLVSGYFEAVNYMNLEVRAASEFISERMSITPAEVLASYKTLKLFDKENNYLLLGGTPSAIDNIAYDLASFLASRGLLRDEVEVDGLTTNQYLP